MASWCLILGLAELEALGHPRLRASLTRGQFGWSGRQGIRVRLNDPGGAKGEVEACKGRGDGVRLFSAKDPLRSGQRGGPGVRVQLILLTRPSQEAK